MPPRHLLVVEGEVAVLLPPDDEALGAQLELRSLPLPSADDEIHARDRTFAFSAAATALAGTAPTPWRRGPSGGNVVSVPARRFGSARLQGSASPRCCSASAS